ncbi:hypothetical protein [Haladaptatus sp. NG-SE-30]
MRETNRKHGNVNRRDYIKGITAGSIAIAGIGGLSMSSIAQDGEPIPAPFCDEASTPPQNPPGGQAGQCIGCVPCTGATALAPLYNSPGDFDGTCFTIAADDIPEGAEYLTFKAGENCFLAEVPDSATGDVTFCLEQVNNQPPMLQDISNATFYACEEENPPSVDNVDVTCDEIVITTSNIPDGDSITVTVEFSDGTSQTEDVEVQNNQATVELPGDVDPVHVQIEYDGLLLFDSGVAASDAPCGEGPSVTDVEVTCAQITIQTANIDEGEELDVTVTFSDDSTQPYTPTVDANGVAVVELPGDLDPTRVVVEYQGQVLFDQFVTADDAPCREEPKCPPDLNIAFKFKYGTWWPDTYDDIGEEVDPDVFSIEGDKKDVTICAPFPFVVSYATREKDHDWDGKKHHKKHGKKHHHKDKKHHEKHGKKHHKHHEKHGKKHHKHHEKHGKKHHKHHEKHGKKHHKHHDSKSCGCFDDCKEQEPVLAEQVDGQFCASISSAGDSDCKKEKRKSKICWFRVHCPEDNGNSGG